MKITLNVDCTPVEARSFFGLPDLSPLHDVYLDKMKAVAADGMKPEDVERVFRMWSSGMSEGLEQWQRLFWQAAGMAGRSGPPAPTGR
jgi:hypothetical protein